MSIKKDIEKEYGNVMISADLILNNPPKVIPFSPRLDIGLGGGVPEGTIMTVTGVSKSGKSTSVLSLAANAQKIGKKVYYFDIEARLKTANLKSKNIDLSEDKFQIVRSCEEKILSAEEHLNIATKLLKEEKDIFVIIDSYSALCSAKEYVEEISGTTRSLGPKILASFCRQIKDSVPIRKSIVVLIGHLIANTSGYGSPFLEDGGNKIKHAADIRMRVKSFELIKNSESVVGQTVKWNIICSSLGFPEQQVESVITFGEGIDDVHENVLLGLDVGQINKSGAWYTFEDKKAQGVSNLKEIFVNDPKLYEILKAKIKSVL